MNFYLCDDVSLFLLAYFAFSSSVKNSSFLVKKGASNENVRMYVKRAGILFFQTVYTRSSDAVSGVGGRHAVTKIF